MELVAAKQLHILKDADRTLTTTDTPAPHPGFPSGFLVCVFWSLVTLN